MSESFRVIPAEVRRLSRLQGLTLVAVAATAGLVLYGRLKPAAAAPGLDASAVRQAVEAEVRSRLEAQEQAGGDRLRALEKRIAAAEAAAVGGDPSQALGDLRAAATRSDAVVAEQGRALRALEARASALEGELRLAEERARGAARLLPGERRVLVSLRHNRGRFEAAVYAPKDGPATLRDVPEAALRYEAVAETPTVAIPVPHGLEGAAIGRALLFVEATLQTDNVVREDREKLHRVELVAHDGSGEAVTVALAPHYFRVDARNPSDALLKTASASAALLLTPKSRLELRISAETLARALKTSDPSAGRLDVFLRIGPGLAEEASK